MDSVGLLVNETWLVQCISAMETSSAERDDVSVLEHVRLLFVKFRNRFELCVVIHANVARILFDIPSNLPGEKG